MEHLGRFAAPEDQRIEPAQATADIIYLNSAETGFDPAHNNPEFRELKRFVLEKMNTLFSLHNHEEVIAEAKQFNENSRTHLRDSEVICLMVAYKQKLEGFPVGYAEVMSFSYDHMEKPFSDGTVWKAFAELSSFGLLRRADVSVTTRAGRPREMFTLTSFGMIALEMAVSYARHLSDCRAQMAA